MFRAFLGASAFKQVSCFLGVSCFSARWLGRPGSGGAVKFGPGAGRTCGARQLPAGVPARPAGRHFGGAVVMCGRGGYVWAALLYGLGECSLPGTPHVEQVVSERAF